MSKNLSDFKLKALLQLKKLECPNDTFWDSFNGQLHEKLLQEALPKQSKWAYLKNCCKRMKLLYPAVTIACMLLLGLPIFNALSISQQVDMKAQAKGIHLANTSSALSQQLEDSSLIKEQIEFNPESMLDPELSKSLGLGEAVISRIAYLGQSLNVGHSSNLHNPVVRL